MDAIDPKTPGLIDPKSNTKPDEPTAAGSVAVKPKRAYKTAPKTTVKKPKNHGNTLPTTNYKYNKRPFGRPTKYRPIFCKMIIDYFTREHVTEYEETHTNRKGETWSCYKLRANPVPMLEGFCGEVLHCGVTIISDWTRNFPDFAEAVIHAQALQMQHLATVTGLGLYNSNWAVFMAKNVSQWRDKKEIEHSGEVGYNLFIGSMIDKSIEAEADREAVFNRN